MLEYMPKAETFDAVECLRQDIPSLPFCTYAEDAEYHQDAAPLELIASKYGPTEW